MTSYFDPEESINYRLDENVNNVISTIANRYLGQNPCLPLVFRTFNKAGILANADGRDNINLDKKFASVKFGQISYVYAKFWAETDRESDFLLSCYGPTRIYFNGALLLKSSVHDDVNISYQKLIPLQIKKGWNTFFIKCIKTASGFGCIFGAKRAKWEPINMLAPFTERAGRAGWIYSEPLDHDLYGDNIPDPDSNEMDTKIKWFPEMNWSDRELQESSLIRIFGDQTNCAAFAWTKLTIPVYGENKCVITGETQGPVEIRIDGKCVFTAEKAEKFQIPIYLKYGSHDLLAKCVSLQKGYWGLSVKAEVNEIEGTLSLPYPIKGVNDGWLYLGTFDPDYSIGDIDQIQTMYKLFHGKEGETYWRVDSPGGFVRPFLENELFGRWNYPLGVTLYGLLQAGRVLKRQDIIDYVVKHITECTKMYEYACWDKKSYGYSSIDILLVELDMLDDCGSFGSTMLEAYKESGDISILVVADIIADHMANKQERLQDGAFYRICKGTWLKNTMWVDDLYMSTPFLARYFKLSGKTEYIDDAAQQFMLFKKYLFIPEYRVMSHVYDFKFNTPTYIPWGRGNGWALFSLSELLAFIPEDHKAKSALIDFFNELCEGYLALQDKHGLWHQVLTDPDSYEESSCTAMFTYAFARGVRYGWINENSKNKYINAAFKAWEGLRVRSIDKYGNVHGVCRGSAYSFTPEYYKQELLWATNDTHGIGIIMLAGIEIANLTNWLK